MHFGPDGMVETKTNVEAGVSGTKVFVRVKQEEGDEEVSSDDFLEQEDYDEDDDYDYLSDYLEEVWE